MYAYFLDTVQIRTCFVLPKNARMFSTDKNGSQSKLRSAFSQHVFLRQTHTDRKSLPRIHHTQHPRQDIAGRTQHETMRSEDSSVPSSPSPPKLTRPQQPKKNPTIPLPITGRWTTTDGPLNPVASRLPTRVCPPPRDCDPNPAPPHPNY